MCQQVYYPGTEIVRVPPYLMLAIVPTGEFLSHYTVVGVSTDEMEDMVAGRCQQIRMQQINRSLLDQYECLREVEPAGRC